MRARNRVSGRDFMHAFILGFEAESRVGNAVYPAHYDVGWHITGTVGRLRRRDGDRQAAGAVGPADDLGDRSCRDAGRRPPRDVRLDGEGVSSRTVGAERLRGGAAGAERDSPRASTASRARADSRPSQAAAYDLSKVTTRLGIDCDLRANTYKPFPCGIVNHPTIDGAIQLHDEHPPGAAIRLPPCVCASRRW